MSLMLNVSDAKLALTSDFSAFTPACILAPVYEAMGRCKLHFRNFVLFLDEPIGCESRSRKCGVRVVRIGYHGCLYGGLVHTRYDTT